MESKQTATDTLALLEDRLRRVDYLFNGDTQARETADAPPTSASATARLRNLERTLQHLAARSPAAADVLSLQKAQPSLFNPTSSDSETTLPPSQLAALVLAHAQLYTTASSHLAQLQDTSIPDPCIATKLVDLQPRIEKARLKQEQQGTEFAELRGRSAQVVEKWYEVGVLGMGEQWAEWEERMRGVEIAVRRQEAAKKRDEEVV